MSPDDTRVFLATAEVLRLGMVDDDGPYVVPVNFGYADGLLYVHGPAEGRRLDAIARDPRVCFEADECTIIRADKACGFTARFRSVIGYGTARVLSSADEKRAGLDVIMRQYDSTGDGIPDATLARTTVIEIAIESMEGKRHLAAPDVEGE
ncbi:MAG: putative flavin-nucleotide-binding [Actinobacteria bacterium]|uniref:pyridoxamine 5'-phosphate oxidase family protein n=1 Tax=Bosea sp. (in: a-proteobacteria) TaxID=1871050 RepID=UPI00132615B7|nr:pyridoxamine 5'-phosphate oxidase family protein [Bosea sp. (in: a-proteobacteria)]KAF0208426.1 MAG: putative flavin-nucleotide-binding [Actinomycetota bacterium]MDP3407222.1 pyridoxamine 5'-phosphate oxidase family protein [Bosea sp. (in: a-proteobacteria)]